MQMRASSMKSGLGQKASSPKAIAANVSRPARRAATQVDTVSGRNCLVAAVTLPSV